MNIDRAPSEDAAAARETPRYPSFVEELMGRVAETERRFEEKKKQIDEEISRTRQRLETDYQRKLELETQKVLLPFLEVLDNLERALNLNHPESNAEGLIRGIEMTVSLFRSKLEALGVSPVSMLNEPFDPNLGQAVGVVEVADKDLDGIVLEEVLRGYYMGDQLLRPAQVRVGRYHEEDPV